MGNTQRTTYTLLELCKKLEYLPPNVYENNNTKIAELNEQILEKISEYKSMYNLYSNEELEYQNVTMIDKDNIFYKKDKIGITEIQYAFKSYTTANIQHELNIMLNMIEIFPSDETKIIARFCINNDLEYDNFIRYDKNKSIKSIQHTKTYAMYPKLKHIAKINNCDIKLVYNNDKPTLETYITNQQKCITIKYIENISSYSSDNYYKINEIIHDTLTINEINLILKS